MSPDLKTGGIDIPIVTPEVQLSTKDQTWLTSFGVDPSWRDNSWLVNELSVAVVTGSRRLDESVNQTVQAHTEIMAAREQFFAFVGVPGDTLESFRVEHPTLIPLDTFIGSLRVMTELGLDAAKVINALPTAISYAPESVRAKFDNLTELGLDAAKVINTSPAAIGLAPESVRAKMKFLDKSARLLRWEYKVHELVETYPAILGFNIQKLRVLRRIAASHITESSRAVDPKAVRRALIVPLEQYIIALNEQTDESIEALDVSSLSREASRHRLDAAERKERAKTVAPHLGKVGVMYMLYRNQ